MNIALIGAGGKMGLRITDNLLKTEHNVKYVEVKDEGKERLRERGLEAASEQEALSDADVVILAVPDVVIGKVAANIVPNMREGSMLVLLDPAAAYLNQLPERSGIAYFVTHPCHPPVFNDETTMEAKRDFFGGSAAKQAVVCALIQGSEEHYSAGERIAKEIYAPVIRAHRMTLEQMATLEPAMAETVGATAALLLRDAMNEAIRKGVPPEAARDFMLGHINILLAVAFGEAKNPLSDACLVAVEYGRKHLLKPEWDTLFTSDSIKEQIESMLHIKKS
jgi:hypothetical protein